MMPLKQIADALVAGEPVPPELATWFAAAAAAIDQGVPADRALGLVGRPGQRSPATRAAIARRDALARAAVQTFEPGACRARQSRWLHEELGRYHGGPWRRVRDAPDCPPQHIGKPAEYFWRMLKARDAVPSAKHFERILIIS
jgi:hypothetical protein